MYTQLAVLYFVGMSAVAATGDVGGCSSQSCRRHIGVYDLIVEVAPNITSYQVATLHTDGTFNAIDSLADGSGFPPLFAFGPFSNVDGVWQCDGSDSVRVNSLLFLYPTQQTSRSVGRAEYKLNLNKYDFVSGAANYTLYDLKSTKNPVQSQWKILLGPIPFKVTGYKLFNTCDH